MRSNSSTPNTKSSEKSDNSTNNSNQKVTTKMTSEKSTNGTTISGYDPKFDWENKFVRISKQFNLRHEFEKTNPGEMTIDTFETSESVQAFMRKGKLSLDQLGLITDCRKLYYIVMHDLAFFCVK